MRGYLGKLAESENLLLVDVICHGVPSPLLWEKWATWREGCADAPLCNVNLRDKESGWLSYSSTYEYGSDEGRTKDGSVFRDDWYSKAFLANASLRSSCFQCPAKRSCGSDITLGDFWGIQDVHPEVDYEGGVSAVLCNSERGAAAIDGLASQLQLGESSFENVSKGNPSLCSAVVPYAKRDKFMADLASGCSIDELMAAYTFEPSLAQKVRGKLGGIKRRLLNR